MNSKSLTIDDVLAVFKEITEHKFKPDTLLVDPNFYKSLFESIEIEEEIPAGTQLEFNFGDKNGSNI